MQHERINHIIFPLFLMVIAYSACWAQRNQDIKLESRSTGTGYSLCGSCTQPKTISSSLWLVDENEPGESIVLSGTIYQSDAVTPDAGIILFVYQTDAGGYYHRPEENVFHPRIFGWLMTGKDGRYEIHSIKPAPEILAPNEPAHIHVHVFGKGMKEHFLHEFWFQGDHRISKDDQTEFAKLGLFSPILTLIKGQDGILKGVRNIRIRPAPEWKYETE